jgi:hypothetical protein
MRTTKRSRMTKGTRLKLELLLQELKDRDLHIHHDVGEFDGVEKPVCWISTVHDPSVGIEGNQISPVFLNEIRLYTWYQRYARVIDVWCEMPRTFYRHGRVVQNDAVSWLAEWLRVQQSEEDCGE